MLIKERAEEILGLTIRNARGDLKSQALEKRMKKLLMEAEELNRDFYYHDPDPVRWCKKFLQLDEAANALPPEELADLRAIVRNKGTIALWARRTKKTTNVALLSFFEAVSLKKKVLIVMPSEQMVRHIANTMDWICHYKMLDGVIRSSLLSNGQYMIDLENQSSITVCSIQIIEKYPHLMNRGDTIYVDEMDMMKTSQQLMLLREITPKHHYRFFSTPRLLFKEAEKNKPAEQIQTPFQQLIEDGKKFDVQNFHLLHRMAKKELIDGSIEAMSRQTVLSELEASYNLDDASIFLGE